MTSSDMSRETIEDLIALARTNVRPDYWPDPVAAKEFAEKYPATFLALAARQEGCRPGEDASQAVQRREAIARAIDPLPFDDGPTGWVGMPETKAWRRQAALAKADSILALSPPPSVGLGWKPTHRHVRRGTTYEVVGSAEVQSDHIIIEGDAVTVYRGDDGHLWARPTHEFNDGRFEPLPSSPSTEGGRGE